MADDAPFVPSEVPYFVKLRQFDIDLISCLAPLIRAVDDEYVILSDDVVKNARCLDEHGDVNANADLFHFYTYAYSVMGTNRVRIRDLFVVMMMYHDEQTGEKNISALFEWAATLFDGCSVINRKIVSSVADDMSEFVNTTEGAPFVPSIPDTKDLGAELIEGTLYRGIDKPLGADAPMATDAFKRALVDIGVAVDGTDMTQFIN